MSITDANTYLRNCGTADIYNSHIERLRGGWSETASLRKALEEIREYRELNK